MMRKLGESSGLIPCSGSHQYTQLDQELTTRGQQKANMEKATEEDVELSKRNGKPDPSRDPAELLPYPKHIFCIISMEACERFSYYGMNAILTIYLISLLKPHYDNDEEKANSAATEIYHVFKFGCYATGLLGATMADSFVGKYRTILYIGMVYCIGQATLAVGALSVDGMPNEAVSYIGIFLIAFGTGGIKPCVVSLGADQFKVPEQAKQMATYFAMFYASINMGSMISTIVIPYLRRVECLEEDSCFSLAFGVPAVLMFIALGLFWAGSWMYKITIPKENIIVIFFKCSWLALTSKKRLGEAHWLDRANKRFPQKTIDDIKAVYRVGVLFLLYPMYWALYDQQGSRWTIQAMKLNGDTFGLIILPDQMQVANPILILLLIPLFDQVIYPLLGKMRLLRTPLQRIVTGCFLCGAAFLVSGVLELQLRKGYPSLPEDGQGKVILHNTRECNFDVTFGDQSVSLPALGSAEFIMDYGDYDMVAVGEGCPDVPKQNVKLAGPSLNLLVEEDGVFQSQYEDKIKKDSQDSMPSIRLLLSSPSGVKETGCTVEIKKDEDKIVFTLDKEKKSQDFEALKLEGVGEHTVSLFCGKEELYTTTKEVFQGANYNLIMTESSDASSEVTVQWYGVTEKNSIHIFWLLPQYFVLTVGEILFSITSMEFAYSQAPASMKSVLQALYLMTTAVGNLITMLIVEIFSALGWEQYIEFFTFAGLMTLFSFGLMAMAHWYEYVYYDKGEASQDEGEGEGNAGYQGGGEEEKFN